MQESRDGYKQSLGSYAHASSNAMQSVSQVRLSVHERGGERVCVHEREMEGEILNSRRHVPC